MSSAIPARMRAACLEADLSISVREMTVPPLASGELLVRTRACGICSGDIMGWYMQRKAPLVFGHEPAGEVAAVGPDVETFRPGDRVFVHHHAPCMRCPLCERGEYVQCEPGAQPGSIPAAWPSTSSCLPETCARTRWRFRPTYRSWMARWSSPWRAS